MSTKKRIVQKLRDAWDQGTTVFIACIFYIVLAALWAFTGMLMSYVYALFAGGGLNNIFCLSLQAIGPIVLFLMVVLWFVSRVHAMKIKHGIYRRRLRYWTGGPLFWGVVVWLATPILLNGLSLLLKANGFDAVGGYVFTYRYYSLPAIPMAIITTVALVFALEGLRGRSGGSKSPPSPPSDGNVARTSQSPRADAASPNPNALQLVTS